jgi:formamidopyrimidine-DNA glycosylase
VHRLTFARLAGRSGLLARSAGIIQPSRAAQEALVPELPELETIVRDLRPLLTGRRILAVRRTSKQALRRPWRSEWEPLLAGQAIDEVRRRGKWIVMRLSSGAFLVVHLGMTGQLTVADAGDDLAAHTHLVFDLDAPGKQLRFRDIRRFGGASVFLSEADLEAFFTENGLGPEPFSLDPKAWRARLAATTRPIKAVLLDQTVVAGVGNIYANESLFVARIHPQKRACDLERAEADRLRKAIATVLTHAIARRGSTIRNYVGGDGLAGGYQDEFRVYGRKGEPCPRCGTTLVSLRTGGRASHYCPACQQKG